LLTRVWSHTTFRNVIGKAVDRRMMQHNRASIMLTESSQIQENPDLLQ